MLSLTLVEDGLLPIKLVPGGLSIALVSTNSVSFEVLIFWFSNETFMAETRLEVAVGACFSFFFLSGVARTPASDELAT